MTLGCLVAQKYNERCSLFWLLKKLLVTLYRVVFHLHVLQVKLGSRVQGYITLEIKRGLGMFDV